MRNIFQFCTGLFIFLCCVTCFADSKNYVLTHRLDAGVVRVGQTATWDILLEPSMGFLIKKTTPFQATVHAEGLTLFKNKYAASDLVDGAKGSKHLSIGLKGIKSGSYHVSCDLVFFVCSEKVCQRQQEKISSTIQVK